MTLGRILALPIYPLYAGVVSIRKWAFNKEILKSNEFDLPIITIGNLSTGGTGKSPHTEYLVRLLKDEFNIATLSRGYKRRTKDYWEATSESSYYEVGDEPLQFKLKFKDDIHVAVDKVRLRGITSLLINHNEIDCIILDDAYQHRAVKGGKSILLTTFNQPFFNDKLLPIGNLREDKSGYDRADYIIVTKCPEHIDDQEKANFIKQIDPLPHQKVFFSKIKYTGTKSINDFSTTIEYKDKDVLLVTGIANANSLKNEIKKQAKSVAHLEFSDHHNFYRHDIDKIRDNFNKLAGSNKVILTTEKDAVRMATGKYAHLLKELPIYFIEIEIELLDKEIFEQEITTYVRQNKDNHRVHSEQNFS